MGTAAAVMSAGQAVGSLVGAHGQAENIKAQGRYQQSIMQMNARIAETQGEDAIRRGNKAANQINRETKQAIGSQRAAYAASGIDVNDGSALDIQEETRLSGEMDKLTVKGNAWREAFGFKSEAMAASQRGELYGMAARNEARNTLLTGGMNAIGYAGRSAEQFRKN